MRFLTYTTLFYQHINTTKLYYFFGTKTKTWHTNCSCFYLSIINSYAYNFEQLY